MNNKEKSQQLIKEFVTDGDIMEGIKKQYDKIDKEHSDPISKIVYFGTEEAKIYKEEDRLKEDIAKLKEIFNLIMAEGMTQEGKEKILPKIKIFMDIIKDEEKYGNEYEELKHMLKEMENCKEYEIEK